MLTQERVKELFDYREDGYLISKKTRGNRCIVGNPVGYSDKRGYKRLSLDYEKHWVHRVIWLWHFGYFPENDIDHINRDKSDNRIENLREVSRQCNMRNAAPKKNNTSGVQGVYRSGKRWRVVIKINYKFIQIGVFDNFDEAVCHRLAAEQAEGWQQCDSKSQALSYVDRVCRNGREAVKECRKQGLKTEADAMKKVIIKLTSTTKCDKKQMSEFMNAISGHAASLGIRLPAE